MSDALRAGLPNSCSSDAGKAPAGELILRRVEHGIQVGVSGGGVFLDRTHVGNNWGLVVRPAVGGDGPIVERTLVAINGSLPVLEAE